MSGSATRSAPPRRLLLNVNILHSGFVPSAWRLPEADPWAFADIQHYIRTAQIAEAGKLDAIFLADNAAIVDQIHFRRSPRSSPPSCWPAWPRPPPTSG